MKVIKPFISALLLASLFSITAGCASLPNVSQMIDDIQPGRSSPRISSAKGLLSPQKSQAILERVKGSANPTDLLERYSSVVETITDSPLIKGNRVTLLADGEATYAAMFQAIESAKYHINLESFIFEDDEAGRKFADRLLQKRAAGVKVHLMYDAVGSMNTPEVFFQHLRDAGIEVVCFNPLSPLEHRDEWGLTHRDHRKILIIDGKLAIMGGVNISKVYSSSPRRRQQTGKTPIHWRDTDIQIEGPAVGELQKLFIDSWLQQKGPAIYGPEYFPLPKEQGSALVQVVGSTPGEDNRIPFVVYVSALSFAEHSIHLTNSYFIPDDQIEKALNDAARRGVDVKVIVPGVSDSKLALYAQRSHYTGLLKSGVQIFEHSNSFLHAKTAVLDGLWSTVGSTNLDYLSLMSNDEVNAIILDRAFAVQMEQMFARDLADSKPIVLKEWQERPLFPRMGEWLVNLFVRWL
jgi:cardiolipin synthase A/B